jgi:predicted ATPase
LIRKLGIHNFRSLGQVDSLELGPLTVLVGPNGSGKSNFCDALRFLSECLREGLDTAISKRNGIDALIRWSSSEPLKLSLAVEVVNEIGEGTWAFQVARGAEGTFHVEQEVAEWKPREGLSYVYFVEAGQWKHRPPGLEPSLEPTALVLPIVAGDSRFHELAAELKNIAIYNISSERLREPQKPNPVRPMLEHGENWASMLKLMEEDVWKPDVLAALGRIVGDIDDIKVSQLGGYLAVSFRHGSEGERERWFDASQESDGTLRCAGILTALLQSPPLTLVGVEAPELIIHPGALPVLYDFFRQASQTSQVLLTTHSPELLDLLDVEEVRVVERKGGVTRVAPLAEEQREVVKRSLMTPAAILGVFRPTSSIRL